MLTINKINLNDATYSINDARLKHFRVSLSYYKENELNGYVYCGGTVLAAVASIVYKDSTPMKQVTALVTKPGTIASTRIDISAYGSGFVSGHVLDVDVIAIIQV